MFFFFFSFPSSFHLLITLCTQPTQIKEQLQSRSRKLELKGFSLSFYLLLLLSPRFSTLLFKQLRPSRGAERGDVLPEPGRSLFTFPFFFFYFISLRQFSAECRGPGITGSNRRAPEHGKGTGARVEDSWRSGTLKQVGNLRPRKKKKHLSPTNGVCHALNAHNRSYTVQTFNTIPIFQVLDVNNKPTRVSEEKWIQWFRGQNLQFVVIQPQKFERLHQPLSMWRFGF